MMEELLIVLLISVILQDILILFLYRPSVSRKDDLTSGPFISVLLAVRDEEDTLRRCIDGLVRQKYPADKFEILVGNDSSADGTRRILREMEKKHAAVHGFDVPEGYHGLTGKAKGIAFLTTRARGDIFLITDADTAPNPDWATSMSEPLIKEGYGLVNGVTIIRKSRFQDMEWVHAQALLKVLSDIWRPVTGIGNNMGVTREAYDRTGGFESIPYSITEDHALYEAARKQGFRLKQLNGPGPLAESLPVPVPGEYLEQRKRWLRGVVKIPVWVQGLLALQSLFVVLVAGLFYYSPATALILLGVRIIVRMPLFLRQYHGLGRRFNPLHVLWFEPVSGFMNILAVIKYFMPGGVRWKGRVYK